ncbi:uncharacterized protein LOC106643072 [Copidosoma floridanum]|uniref:uncharacterized protein LOC106643072 n=1 Tax=Copidosoma floridanum TaxID=29053 RepID=UPI0006C94AE8|nr:uncharacterized protein LOC106643072 [Copidosoma floridanum]
MASYKHIALSAVVLAVLAVGIGAVSLTQGSRQTGDTLACYGDVHLPAQYGRSVSASRICNVPNPRQLITFIQAQDLGTLGRGGYAQITSGGLYQRTVTVHMWSQPGQPLDFNLNVFAKSY